MHDNGVRRLLLIAALVFSACGEDREIPPAQQGVDASVLDAGAADAGRREVCIRTCFDTGQAIDCLYDAAAGCEPRSVGSCQLAGAVTDGTGLPPACR